MTCEICGGAERCQEVGVIPLNVPFMEAGDLQAIEDLYYTEFMPRVHEIMAAAAEREGVQDVGWYLRTLQRMIERERGYGQIRVEDLRRAIERELVVVR